MGLRQAAGRPRQRGHHQPVRAPSALGLDEIEGELAEVDLLLLLIGMRLPPCRDLEADHHAGDNEDELQADGEPVLLTDALREPSEDRVCSPRTRGW